MLLDVPEVDPEKEGYISVIRVGLRRNKGNKENREFGSSFFQTGNLPTTIRDMSHFSYACKTEGENGISRLISALCINCMSAILEYSRIMDYSIIWMYIWCGLLQKLHKIKKSEHLNSKVSFKL